jgi:hypothetical protein
MSPPSSVTGAGDFLTASLHHRNLQVDTSDPNPRPMIAVLDAFISAIPGLSTGGPASLVQLNEIPIPDSDPAAVPREGPVN